jgi:predicted HTH domain antitoxin
LKIILNQATPAFLKRYEYLSNQMENGTISPEELVEMTAYMEKIEEFDTNKIIALQEYAELKKMSIEQVMKELNPFNRNK